MWGKQARLMVKLKPLIPIGFKEIPHMMLLLKIARNMPLNLSGFKQIFVTGLKLCLDG